MSQLTEAERALLEETPGTGPCIRLREGCWEIGAYMPFYRSHVCGSCLELDSADVRAGINPPGHGGIGTLFQKGDEAP